VVKFREVFLQEIRWEELPFALFLHFSLSLNLPFPFLAILDKTLASQVEVYFLSLRAIGFYPLLIRGIFLVKHHLHTL